MAVAVVQLLLVLCIALLVVHSQGQSEASITGLVDNSTLTEWGLFAGTSSQRLNRDLDDSERQFLFTGLRFRCSGIVTKWIVGAAFAGIQRSRYPALGIYRDRPGGGFADRIGGTVFMLSNAVPSLVYEFTPDPPLPFQTNDSLGIYLPPIMDLRVRLLHRRITGPGAPASRNYVPSNSPAELQGVSTFDFARDPTEETDRLPLVAVEIESDDPDSADCTRDFISRDLLELLAPPISIAANQQIVFSSSHLTSDGAITSWTLAAQWVDAAGRNRFPELQIWRRRSGDTYDRIASTELTATAESPNQLYTGTIDPPLQFQSGDLLGMFLLPVVGSNGARMLIYFARGVGLIHECRATSVPLSAIEALGLDTCNDRPLLALEMSPVMPSTKSTTTSTVSADTAPGLSIPKAGIIIGVFIGGVPAAVVIVLIVVATVAYARKKNQNPNNNSSVAAINTTATTEETYEIIPFQDETTAVSTRHHEANTTAMSTAPNEAFATAMSTAPNEAYATAMSTAPNEAYATAMSTAPNQAYATAMSTAPNQAYATAMSTAPNEAYATTRARGGDITGTTDHDDHEYEYIHLPL